jgi:hypothetical protein
VPIVYFSVYFDQDVGGLSVGNEDIVAFDGESFSLYFDGSDVGLTAFRLDAFTVLSPSEVLMSFTGAGSIPDISGTVDDSDIVRFTGTLGSQTSGAFDLYFDASDVWLTRDGEDVDAVERLPNGHLLISTAAGFNVNGLTGYDEDIVEFTPTSLGPSTAGTWALYFRGREVALDRSSEDVDALAVTEGDIYLSTTGDFNLDGFSGADEDVFVCNSPTTGTDTSCSFFTLFFDGSDYGLGDNDLFAIDLP